MHRRVRIVAGVVLLVGLPFRLFASPLVQHALSVRLAPDSGTMMVTDTLTIPEDKLRDSRIYFSLHGSLIVDRCDRPLKKLATKDTPETSTAGVPVASYEVRLPAGVRTLTLSYHGRIHHKIASPEQQAVRSFSESPGLIDKQGVYLASSSLWFPRLNDALLAFKLDLDLPSGWDAISQGSRTRHDTKTARTRVTWEESAPQDDIYVVAAKFQEYAQSSGNAQIFVFLRTPDDALATKYLDATGQYLKMYEELLGAYPYKKFALIENFWETGYGMPSFTLLGEKIIRFPFIISSSYPHEILHNWWGNSVYVDYQTGNWAEGLTAYLADHLLKEQRGQGAEHRRDTLQKYSDFVSTGKDFPLTQFVSRHSSATEAVGYGKTMMFFHMLRLRLGDKLFSDALRRFYKEKKFQYATFDDLEQAFSAVSVEPLNATFSQWVGRTGAPQLAIRSASARPQADKFQLDMALSQNQPGLAYRLDVPIAVTMEGSAPSYQTTISMKDKSQTVSLVLPSRPLTVRVDPEFDVFRRLHASEIPSALSQGFGATRAVAVLPRKANAARRQALQALIRQWQHEIQISFDVKWDTELKRLPDADAVWLLGWDNEWRSQFSGLLEGQKVVIDDSGVAVDGKKYARGAHQAVLTARQRDNSSHTVLWLGVDGEKEIANLARKLPHYQKYSYLIFAGDASENVLKGQWPVFASPVVATVTQADGTVADASAGTLAKRAPLIELPATFSTERLRADIEFLAHPDREGRGAGTAGLRHAGDYIAEAFARAGLQPGGEKGGYFQSWKQDIGSPIGTVDMRNVIGFVPGTDPRLQGQCDIVSAHYDHLGRDWPRAMSSDVGKIHAGADDNASGVAVMLEYLRAHGAKAQAPRTVMYIAFDGEEWERAGSRYYVDHTDHCAIDKTMAVVNLDTVGRLGNNTLTIFGTGTASEWVHIFRGAGFVTGVPITTVANEWGSSDQRSFYDKGVSGVQLFGGVHLDFHRPSDTPDKVDYQGLAKVASVLKEAVVYLAQRVEPLNVTLPAAGEKTNGNSANARRVSLGTVPDYAWQGRGVRITDVVADSPAQKAGVQAGDIITAINGEPMEDLRKFSQKLREFKLGEQIEITVVRGDQTLKKSAILTAR